MASLPPNLMQLALERFDSLVATGELLYETAQPSYTTDHGFHFQFLCSPILKRKPVLSADDPGRSKAIGPFVTPEPQFLIAYVGASHVLELSKYCMLRPQFVLHTKAFAQQTVDLDEADMDASLEVVRALGGRQILLYNCGVEAGSSQGHKHLQVLPRMPEEEFLMFADRARGELKEDEPTCLPNVPFIHAAFALPPSVTASHILARYRSALAFFSTAFADLPDYKGGHNLVLVDEWMVVVPRRWKGEDGVGAGGVGMMGSVWVRDQGERDAWTRFGMGKYLAAMGIPNPEWEGDD